MTELASCPKCGFERQSGAVECPACGIIYDRYDPERAAQRRLAAEAQVAPAGGTMFDPYRAPEAAVSDLAVVARGTELARRFSRLAAVVLDGLIYFGVMMVAFVPIFIFAGAAEAGAESQPISDPVLTALMLFAVVAGLAIFIINLYLLHRDGQTLGKKALGIRIVRTNDERASLGRIFGLRMLVPGLIGSVPLIGPIFSLADALFIFGEERRCIHDHFADTKVVIA